jgi:hypothetical protein
MIQINKWCKDHLFICKVGFLGDQKILNLKNFFYYKTQATTKAKIKRNNKSKNQKEHQKQKSKGTTKAKIKRIIKSQTQNN